MLKCFTTFFKRPALAGSIYYYDLFIEEKWCKELRLKKNLLE